MLCDHIEGCDREGRREAHEGGDMGIYIYIYIYGYIYIYVYIYLIHFVIKQKLTQHCKAIILQ